MSGGESCMKLSNTRNAQNKAHVKGYFYFERVRLHRRVVLAGGTDDLRRQGDGETGRRGDGETGRRGDEEAEPSSSQETCIGHSIGLQAPIRTDAKKSELLVGWAAAASTSIEPASYRAFDQALGVSRAFNRTHRQGCPCGPTFDRSCCCCAAARNYCAPYTAHGVCGAASS